jgi:hypothetical protein
MVLGPVKPLTSRVLGPLSPSLKQMRNVTDHSPPPSAQVTNVQSYTTTHTYALMVWCLITGGLTLPYNTVLTDSASNEEAFFER